ncbi:hypothetical protein T06_13995 [Trichinella sp. T6]|nr:hypothetical protein T06_13995 [Trichinella sp. T6]
MDINLDFGEVTGYTVFVVAVHHSISYMLYRQAALAQVTSRMHFIHIDDHFSAAFLYFRQTMNVTANTQIKAAIGIAEGHKAN